MREGLSFVKTAFVSDLIRFPNLNAQDPGRAFSGAAGGILVGRMHSMPYFLNLESAVNPHVFVCGVTGSGKTYLMRNLMLKLARITDCAIVLIDFTGEYGAFAEIAGGRRAEAHEIAELLMEGAFRILYLNLKNCGKERKRKEAAEEALNQITERMRSEDKPRRRVFVMLDEAWKLLEGSGSLHALLREGRKYGYGLIFSSQLVEDIDMAMLSNAATLFIFRLQNKSGLSRLAANYALSGKQVDMIQELQVGSCIAIQSLASGKREFCLIERVHGIELDEGVSLRAGDGTRFEIARQKFEDAMRDVCGPEAIAEAMRAEEQAGYIELTAMIAHLMKCGASRRKLLEALRKLGVDDGSIADSFAAALSSKAEP
jgi:hypothetical protein